jgi:hypothetical protein
VNLIAGKVPCMITGHTAYNMVSSAMLCFDKQVSKFPESPLIKERGAAEVVGMVSVTLFATMT